MIYHFAKKLIQIVFRFVGLGLVRASDLEVFRNRAEDAALADFDFKLLPHLSHSDSEKFMEIRRDSKAQLRQDFLALMVSKYKTKGFFVEIGAADGIFASNTLMLEKSFGWSGILAEPAKSWQKKLKEYRSALITTKAVYSETGKNLDFFESEATNISTLADYRDFDGGGIHRKKFRKYPVETITLFDLLNDFKAPKIIDYLSIDTEGSEFEIISGFPFELYEIHFISIEHNYNINRGKIRNLLESKGFQSFLPELSQYDDWYLSHVL